MILIEHAPGPDEILDAIADAVRRLQDDGLAARTILVGPRSYETLRDAISRRFDRPEGRFETYQYLSIVLDPGRDDTVLVLPAPADVADGARLVRA